MVSSCYHSKLFYLWNPEFRNILWLQSTVYPFNLTDQYLPLHFNLIQIFYYNSLNFLLVNLHTFPASVSSFYPTLLFQWKRYFLLLSCAQLLSSVRLFTTPWTKVQKTPLPMEFSKQEHWSGWGAIAYFRGSSQYRDWTWVSCFSCIGRWILYH